MQSCSAKAVAVILGLSTLLGLLYVSQHYRDHFLCDQTQTRLQVVGELKEGTVERADPQTVVKVDPELPMSRRLEYPQPSITRGRTDVVTVTPWLAPVVWEGTFNPTLLDSIYKPKNLTIAATVFAVGKYVMFLKDFLETAEQFFFVGFKVHIYVLTDRPNEVPRLKMAAGRKVLVHSIPGSQRWQEISARRMEMVNVLLKQVRNQTDFVFCLDVDSRFHGPWGPESLSGLVSVVHPGYYGDLRFRFPYERRPQSRAYMAPSDGDFYYCGGAFGGSVDQVLVLAQTCSSAYRQDEREGIEAAWQEESHLNRYFWENKPTKVLSPEYLWQDFKTRNPEIHVVRFSGVVKNYAAIRPNA